MKGRCQCEEGFKEVPKTGTCEADEISVMVVGMIVLITVLVIVDCLLAVYLLMRYVIPERHFHRSKFSDKNGRRKLNGSNNPTFDS